MLCVSVWLWFLHEGLRDLLFLGCPFIIPYTYLTFYLFTRGGDDEQGNHSFLFPVFSISLFVFLLSHDGYPVVLLLYSLHNFLLFFFSWCFYSIIAWFSSSFFFSWVIPFFICPFLEDFTRDLFLMIDDDILALVEYFGGLNRCSGLW